MRPATFDVEFSDVGRGNRSWTSTFDGPVDERALGLVARKAKERGGLMSSEISAALDPKTGEGMIYAGFRGVGTFRLLPSKEASEA